MPIPMEPQRQAIGNLIDLKSHCEGESVKECNGTEDGNALSPDISAHIL